MLFFSSTANDLNANEVTYAPSFQLSVTLHQDGPCIGKVWFEKGKQLPEDFFIQLKVKVRLEVAD